MIEALKEDIDNQVNAVRAGITNAAIAEHAEKIEGYKRSKAKIAKAVANEINRWDSRQLMEAMDLTRARVQAVFDAGDDVFLKKNAGRDLEAIYQEAVDSGDPVKLRATAEVFRSVLYNMPEKVGSEGRLIANRLQFRADEVLRQLKETEELQDARQAEENAWKELMDVQNDLFVASQTLDGYSPDNIFGRNAFTLAARRVRSDRTILKPDDPEVTGIVEPSQNEIYG